MANTENKGILAQLGAIPGWLITLITIVLVIIPLFYPLGLPVPISEPARDFYKTIEALPSGGVVVVAFETEPSGWTDVKDATYAMMKEMYRKDLKVIYASFLPNSDPVLQGAFSVVNAATFGKTYGTDWVYLGYISGEESAVAKFADDMQGTVSIDYKGTPISQLPIMQGLQTGKNVNLVIIETTGVSSHEKYVRQYNSRYGTALVEVVASGSSIGVIPYYPTIIKGYLAGASGGAMLEILTNSPGGAARITDIKNLALLFSVILIFLGNISYYGLKFTKKSEQKEVVK